MARVVCALVDVVHPCTLTAPSHRRQLLILPRQVVRHPQDIVDIDESAVSVEGGVGDVAAKVADDGRAEGEGGGVQLAAETLVADILQTQRSGRNMDSNVFTRRSGYCQEAREVLSVCN